LDEGAEAEMLGRMTALVPKLAEQLGIAADGFRLVVNTGKEGGQTVHHLHFHILGGRSLQWPPG
ncbi:MAG: HIT domain-containing protein, partial [Syntrophomonadaceae bacterium]|nr:HIT domain-containing protein [Syntrophomonadaceae bacterium]NLH28560.1 HIT domain-containing protein [Syntrophomonadaceae bacterium]